MNRKLQGPAHVRMIAMDLDGTLLTSEKVVDPSTRDALLWAKSQGVTLVLATGRGHTEIEAIAAEPLRLREGDHYAAAMNGQEIYSYRTGEVDYGAMFTEADARRIIPLVRSLDTELTLCSPDGNFGFLSQELEAKRDYGYDAGYRTLHGGYLTRVIRDGEIPAVEKISKFILLQREDRLRRSVDLLRRQIPEYDYYMIGPEWAEIMPRGVSKGKAVLEIAKRKGVSPEEVLVFGDAENDLTMFQLFPYAIAMGGAAEVIQEAAFDITADCDHAGIAKSLGKYKNCI